MSMAQSSLVCFILVNLLVAVACENGAYKAEAPTIRKLGKHQYHDQLKAPVSSPSQAPRPSGESPTAAPIEASNGDNVSAEGQSIHLLKPHHSIDKSVAGGGVILGGLATTFLVAVFCYIRATGRHKSSETNCQSSTTTATEITK